MKLLLTLMISAMLVQPGWLEDLDQAKKEAKQKNLPILLYISGSDWCVPCRKLSQAVYETDKFREYAKDNLVLVNADFPRQKKNQPSPEQVKKNEAVAEQYNKTGAFPLTILLDADGKVIRKWEGYAYDNPDAFIKAISSCGR